MLIPSYWNDVDDQMFVVRTVNTHPAITDQPLSRVCHRSPCHHNPLAQGAQIWASATRIGGICPIDALLASSWESSGQL
jgi:hypothetical protein